MAQWKKGNNISFANKLKNILQKINELELDKKIIEQQKNKLNGLQKILDNKKK